MNNVLWGGRLTAVWDSASFVGSRDPTWEPRLAGSHRGVPCVSLLPVNCANTFSVAVTSQHTGYLHVCHGFSEPLVGQ